MSNISLKTKYYIVLGISIASAFLIIFTALLTCFCLKNKTNFVKYYITLLFSVCVHSISYALNWKAEEGGKEGTLYGKNLCIIQGFFNNCGLYLEGAWVLIILIEYYIELRYFKKGFLTLMKTMEKNKKNSYIYFSVGLGFPIIISILFIFSPGYEISDYICQTKESNIFTNYLPTGLLGLTQIVCLVFFILIIKFIRSNNSKSRNVEIRMIISYIKKFLFYPCIFFIRAIVHITLNEIDHQLVQYINIVISCLFGIVYPISYIFITEIDRTLCKKREFDEDISNFELENYDGAINFN